MLLLPLALLVALMAQPCVFDEFDYWAGTFMLVVFAAIEAILFAWVFGMPAGWNEITSGAEIRIPHVFYYILKYVTPLFLAAILFGSIFQPQGLVPARDENGDPKVDAAGKPVMVERGWEAYIQAVFAGEPFPEKWEWSGQGMIGKLLHNDRPPPPETATPEEVAYHNNVMFFRNVSRLVLVGIFSFLALLVGIAWTRRRARGEGTT